MMSVCNVYTCVSVFVGRHGFTLSDGLSTEPVVTFSSTFCLLSSYLQKHK